MEHHIDKFAQYFSYRIMEQDDEDYKRPWYTNQHKERKIVLDKAGERNKCILNQVQFVVCQTKGRKALQCNYYVFDNNDKQARYELRRLPDPPSGLRIYLQANRNSKKSKISSLSIRVEWDYGELGVPCTFVLQSQLKGTSEFSIQQRTVAPGQKHLNTHFETGPIWEIRVAAETCIGFGEFSQIVSTESAVFDDDEENQLSPPRKKPNICLQTTTYLATVSTGDGSPSNAVVLTTTGTCRFAKSLVMRSEKIRNEDGKDLYAVPLEKEHVFLTTSKRFVFGEADQRDGHYNRTVLLIGACGSGKTSLINSMINYVFDVDLDDPFRFQLIDPEANQNVITVYKINFADGFRVDYSLTIINTPNYVDEDAEKNKQITDVIRKFFADDVSGIQQVDMVGFVVDSSECELESV